MGALIFQGHFCGCALKCDSRYLLHLVVTIIHDPLLINGGFALRFPSPRNYAPWAAKKTKKLSPWNFDGLHPRHLT